MRWYDHPAAPHLVMQTVMLIVGLIIGYSI